MLWPGSIVPSPPAFRTTYRLWPRLTTVAPQIEVILAANWNCRVQSSMGVVPVSVIVIAAANPCFRAEATENVAVASIVGGTPTVIGGTVTGGETNDGGETVILAVPTRPSIAACTVAVPAA